MKLGDLLEIPPFHHPAIHNGLNLTCAHASISQEGQVGSSVMVPVVGWEWGCRIGAFFEYRNLCLYHQVSVGLCSPAEHTSAQLLISNLLPIETWFYCLAAPVLRIILYDIINYSVGRYTESKDEGGLGCIPHFFLIWPVAAPCTVWRYLHLRGERRSRVSTVKNNKVEILPKSEFRQHEPIHHFSTILVENLFPIWIQRINPKCLNIGIVSILLVLWLDVGCWMLDVGWDWLLLQEDRERTEISTKSTFHTPAPEIDNLLSCHILSTRQKPMKSFNLSMSIPFVQAAMRHWKIHTSCMAVCIDFAEGVPNAFSNLVATSAPHAKIQ